MADAAPERLRAAFLTSIPQEPSQFDQVEPRFVFRPDRHIRALDPSSMLVSGARGAGKSFWWYALQNDEIRSSVLPSPDGKVTASAGFGQADAEDRPGADVLVSLLERGHPPRLIWKAVVLRHVLAQTDLKVALPSRWSELVAWVRDDPERTAEILRTTDNALRDQRRIHVVLFDALDRSSSVEGQRHQLLRGLLELVLELRARASVRAKVFARPDMLEHSEVRTFPDASKVLSTAVRLDWPPLDLYGLLFNYLANATDDEAAASFRALSTGTWGRTSGRWTLPDRLRTDADEQARVFVALAGPYMGTNQRRGRTYPWLPNHIADARGEVSPRSFLAAMRAAADAAAPGQPHALHWRGIQQGVRRASEIRSGEIRDDLDWADEAMSKLDGVVVPCDRALVLRKWQPRIANRTPNELLHELIGAGVIAQLPDGRLNVPDLYRVAYGLRRKGGFVPTAR